MKKISELAVTTTLVLLFAAICSAQARRPMAPADILRIANVGDAQISPNAQWVVYSVSTVDGDRTISTLWFARIGPDFSGPARQPTIGRPPTAPEYSELRTPPSPLLPPGWNASTPRWSPDSNTIAFLSNRDGGKGIWIVNVTRREPRFIATVEDTNFFITYAGESFTWAPDSKRIAYISASEEFEADPASRKSDDPRVIDRIQYKSRTSLSDNRLTHVWIVDTEKPEPRQLTTGPFYDHAVSFSPRGDEIAFLSNHEPNPDANNNSDIFAVDTSGQVRQITQTKGCEYEPVWSPDGRWIAYTATKRDTTTIDSVAEDTHVWSIPAAGGAGRELTAEQDQRARIPRWSSDSRSILFLAGDKGRTLIYRVASEGGAVRPLTMFTIQRTRVDDRRIATLTRPSQVGSFSISSNRGTGSLMALTISDATYPPELWLNGLLSGDMIESHTLVRISRHNDALMRYLDLSEPEELDFRSFDGTPIQGWLMKPVGFREDRRYPLILSVHGGPHGMYGWGFNATLQAYAARGYAVLYLNPRGSSGYGQKFSDGTLNEWGGGDYKDLMRGVDEALRKYSWIDQERLGVTGGSYGGFMTNWIITQTSRFKAAVASASVSNLISFYATSLYQDLVHAEFGGFPWDNYELLWQWSPLRYVAQVQTPTLFIHGEQDNDVHITQAEEMYMALKRRGVEAVFVRYPREGHGLREPRHRVDALERTIAWFDRFLK